MHQTHQTQVFLIADKIADIDVVVTYKPTTEIWVDINMKPKQGAAFQLDWSKMMNCPIDLPDHLRYQLP